MGNAAQFGGGGCVTLAAQILHPHAVPQAKPQLIAVITDAGNATGQQSIGALFAPDWQVGARIFIQHRTSWVHATKLPAALKVSLHNRGNFLRHALVALKRRNRDRQLRQPRSGDLDTELRQGMVAHEHDCQAEENFGHTPLLSPTI